MTPEQKRIKCTEILGWRKGVTTSRLGTTLVWIQYDPVDSDKELRRASQSPNYLTDPNAALELIEHMRNKGWIMFCNNEKEGYHVEFFRSGLLAAFNNSARSHIFCEAVVDAFLKANKVEEVETVK